MLEEGLQHRVLVGVGGLKFLGCFFNPIDVSSYELMVNAHGGGRLAVSFDKPVKHGIEVSLFAKSMGYQLCFQEGDKPFRVGSHLAVNDRPGPLAQFA